MFEILVKCPLAISNIVSLGLHGKQQVSYQIFWWYVWKIGILVMNIL